LQQNHRKNNLPAFVSPHFSYEEDERTSTTVFCLLIRTGDKVLTQQNVARFL